jgi:hypothetical protein
MDPHGWPLAFVLTIVLETPVYLLALRRTVGAGHAVLVALLLNAATHPLAWSLITDAREPFPAVFLLVEAGVLITEALGLWLLGRSRWSRGRLGVAEALAMAFAANGVSAGVGLLW